MRATLIYGAEDVRVEDVPDPRIQEPTDAVVRVLRAAICGSDLWPYRSRPATDTGDPIGHEFLGTIEDIGAEVPGFKVGDLVVAPFAYCDNTCEFCADGLQTSCMHGGFWAVGGIGGGQAEAVRVVMAPGTLVKLPVAPDDSLLPSLLTLADVFCTGHHAAVKAGVGPRTSVTVIGDGAVGLSAVLAARRLGAERILLMGSHKERTDLGRDFGATDVITERGEDGVERARELAGGYGTHAVLECVGTLTALETALGVVRAGGVISRVGVPQYTEGPIGFEAMFHGNVTLTGGPAPARAYMEELMPDILAGTIQPGRVFDNSIGLADVPAGYRAMANREALKVLIRP
ncbi:MAG TPA: alcohol dehydrogenase catalytic domain-containing protein [Streptosporangiaceae bacterium]|nr:alcohol dehydrogenase catalytic domain-containing protein [Streptosporangiaceae bacterium]